MKKYYFGTIFLILLCSCSSVETELGSVLGTRGGGIHRFHATTEQSSPETKVYADEQLRVLWNEGDLLSVFNQSTYNSKFEFAGEDGDNAGDFDDVTPSGLHSGNPLSNIYAVYPYDKGNKINNDGNTITLTLPAEQQYKEHSFGIGANTMVAVTDNDFLAFKNLGGYLQLRLYGNDVKVSSITIQGNNGEKISGKASVAVVLGVLPAVTMDDTATDAITLVCDPPVQLGSTAEDYTDFWFVIPPTTFSGGFTITVTDELGGVFEKTTTKSLTIARSTIEWMSALLVTPNYDNVNVVFENANFKAYCVENFDTNHDGEISIVEAANVTEIIVGNPKIVSLKGIEFFTNLKSLSCNSLYYLTSLDLSNNLKLSELSCNDTELTSLDVSNNVELTYLSCGGNQLTNLDVSNNTKLTILRCYCNQLTALDISHNAALTGLDCRGNSLESLDISNNGTLTWLNCGGNLLADLDLSNNTALIGLNSSSNQLSSIDVSNNTALDSLLCYENKLTTLDVSNNTALQLLWCDNNPNLTEIWLKTGQSITDFYYDTDIATIRYKDGVVAFEDANFKAYCVGRYDTDGDGEISMAEAELVTAITVNPGDVASLKGIEQFENLDSLNCSLIWQTSSMDSDGIRHYYYNGDEIFSKLKSIDVSHNTKLQHLVCRTCSLQELDISNNSALKTLNCSENLLSILDVSNNNALIELVCDNNQLSSIDISGNPSLITFICRSSNMINVNLNNNTNLKILWIEDNQLSSLDVSNNKSLTNLSCGVNQLSILDVSNNTDLTSLSCDNNKLKRLDISNNLKLKTLVCDKNQLDSLDISNNSSLSFLSFSDNMLTSLDVSHNLALSTLQGYNNQINSLDVSNNATLSTLHCSGNQLSSLDVSNNTSLKHLSCATNQLTSLDVSNNTALTSIYCNNNQLTSLDVSNNPALTRLDCYSNQLMTLDLGNNTALTQLFCHDNQLTSLDVSKNTLLYYLYCYRNPNLTEIWLKTGQSITNFSYDRSVATIKYKD